MIPLDTLNRRLAPLGKRLYRVRSRAGVVRYSLGPNFLLTWTTYTDALADLAALPFLRDTAYGRLRAEEETWSMPITNPQMSNWENGITPPNWVAGGGGHS